MSTVVSPAADAVVVRHDSSVVVARKNGGTTVVNQPQRTSAFVVRGVPGLPGPAGPQGVQGVPGPQGKDGQTHISADTPNRLRWGSDGGLYVPDDLVPDPLAYYILAKA